MQKINFRKWIRRIRTAIGLLGCLALVIGLVRLGGEWLQRAALVSAQMQLPVTAPQYWTDGQPTPTFPVTKPSISDPFSEGQAQDGIPWVSWEIPLPQKAPGEKGDGGKILEKRMAGGQYTVNGVSYTNRSNRTELDMQAVLQTVPQLTLYGDQPIVLLMHTHTTESYMAYDAGYYNKSDPSRLLDPDQNVVLIGEMMAQQLRAAGIPTLHDSTVHDQPYSGAYTRSLKTVEQILKQYPSIQVVIDVHRDGIMADETTKVKPTVKINGEKVAQVMLLVGLADTAAAPNPGWQNNLAIAARLQQFADSTRDGLMRPMVLREGRFNQHTAPYCFLVEMGSDSNTLPEAMRAADLFGKRLALYLREELGLT